MKADFTGRVRTPLAGVTALLSALVALLAPKCPLCLYAYLSLFGVSLGAASAALPLLRPIAAALAVSAVAFVVLGRRTASRCHTA